MPRYWRSNAHGALQPGDFGRYAAIAGRTSGDSHRVFAAGVGAGDVRRSGAFQMAARSAIVATARDEVRCHPGAAADEPGFESLA